MVVQLLGYCGQLSEECSAGMHNFTRMLKLANQGKQFFLGTGMIPPPFFQASQPL